MTEKNIHLDPVSLYVAVATCNLYTPDILALAEISKRTWTRACKGKPIRAQTAGRIARALNVPVIALLPQNK